MAVNNGSERADDNDLHYRVLVLGETGVGKSSLISMLSTNHGIEPGEEVEDFHKAQVCTTIVGKHTVSIQLWDGSEGVKEVQTKSRRFPKNTDALLLVYAIDSEKSAAELDGFLTEGLKNSKGAGVLLVGNKLDLKKERQVTLKAAQQLAASMDAPRAYELSATNAATAAVFIDEMARYLMNRNGVATPSAKKGGKCTIM